jgi:Tol biopolymer transport system component
MNQTTPLERDLAAWFDETATPRTPDYVDHILAQTAARRQRGAWTFPERWLPMSAITLARKSLRPVPVRTMGLIAVLVLLVLAAVAVALYAGSQRRLPAPFGPAGNGSVVFEESGDIVVLDPASGVRRAVITGEARDTTPTFSRDGTRIAFFRDVAGVASLWLANADGSDQRAISPAGTRMALPEDASLSDNSIEWSRDGKAIIAAAQSDGVSMISIFSADGTASVRSLDVGMPADGATWRPAGEQEILFRGTTPTGFGLFTVRPDGTGLRAVVQPNGMNDWDALFFNWSPDGTHIAYQWRDGNGAQLIYVVPAGGGARRAITATESVGVAWSPDGSKVAYTDSEHEGGAVIGIVSADGSGEPVRTPITADVRAFAWTPDGRKLLFATADSAKLYLADPATGQVEPTTWSAAGVPHWQRVAP